MSTVADGPDTNVSGRIGSTNGEGLGYRSHDLVGPDDAKVVVGEERQRPAAHPGAAVEDDRPGLRDRQRARGQDAVGGVEGVVVERRLLVSQRD